MTIADFAVVCHIRNLIERWNLSLTDYPRVEALYKKLKGKFFFNSDFMKPALDIDCFVKSHPDLQLKTA